MNFSEKITTIENQIDKRSILPISNDMLPCDSITCTAWNTQNPLQFGVTSFDGTFRLYEIISANQTQFTLKMKFIYSFPLITFTFIGKSGYVAIGTCDHKILVVNVSSNMNKQISQFDELKGSSNHQSPIKKLFYNDDREILISVDMSTCINIWNFKKFELLSTVSTKSQILDADFMYPLLFLALSSRKIQILNITQTSK
jgi:WD40 repeat protein